MRRIVLIIFISAACLFMLNISVSMNQCVDYKCFQRKIPLYLKILDFFDRHYNYKRLTREIVGGVKTEEEKVMKIFAWTAQNIRRVPPGFPVVDDHIWHIIVRGYGADDQSCDVFATLCNYAGSESFYAHLDKSVSGPRIFLAFTRIKDEWYAFDPYRGIYFVDAGGKLIALGRLKEGAEYSARPLKEGDTFDYSGYFANLPGDIIVKLGRSNIQFPLKRLIFEVNKWVRRN
ncbi:MAG: transglutaminase domain-containing protein [Candidatus Omnitrophica bacterium]|nr:transglutaminase domain-containing protein [Candidatus Omnitrophota bacterium]